MIGFFFLLDGDFVDKNSPHEGRSKTFEDAVLEAFVEWNHHWETVSNSIDSIEVRTVWKISKIRAKAGKSYSTACDAPPSVAKHVKTFLENLK